MIRLLALLFNLSFGIVGGVVGVKLSRLYIPVFWPGNPTNERLYTLAFWVLGMLVGFVVAGMIFRQIVNLGHNLRRVPADEKIAAVFGLFVGLGLAILIGLILYRIPDWGPLLVPVSSVLCIFIGITIAMSMKEELLFFFPGATISPSADSEADAKKGLRCKLLDTNVIIDGRISDICRTGFVEGPVYIPGFVLEELHMIADSADNLRRNRGRRGLDILNQMQKDLKMLVKVYDDYPIDLGNEGVDAKLVRLAKHLDGAIITNDFNLNKVASLQGVTVLNVNELANAVKPVVLPGEEMSVTLVKEGKEAGQGVAYLDDGTMVVVENGKQLIGQEARVIVSTVLQTVAGKMIFATLRSQMESEDESAGLGNYSGSRIRKKARFPS